MGQKKLIRFEAIKSFPNVLQYPTGMQGNWHSFFKNEHPLTLELACGKGEYTVGLARLYPERNFLGLDLKGNRIYIGAKTCLKEGLSNAAFIRTHIDKKTDYPLLYRFTKRVIDMYGLQLLEDMDNVYAHEPLSPELSIKTHYEGLDI